MVGMNVAPSSQLELNVPTDIVLCSQAPTLHPMKEKSFTALIFHLVLYKLGGIGVSFHFSDIFTGQLNPFKHGQLPCVLAASFLRAEQAKS